MLNIFIIPLNNSDTHFHLRLVSTTHRSLNAKYSSVEITYYSKVT